MAHCLRRRQPAPIRRHRFAPRGGDAQEIGQAARQPLLKQDPTPPRGRAPRDGADPLPPPRVVTAERWLLLGVILGVGLAMAVALASFLAILRLQEDGARVAHAQEVIGALEGVLTTAAEAEAAALNYVTLGDAGFLRLYDDAARDLNANLGRVGRLVKSPEQVRHLPALAVLSEQRMVQLAVLLEARQREGFGAARERIAQRDQERLHQAIRRLVTDLEAGERGLLKKRRSNPERSP